VHYHVAAGAFPVSVLDGDGRRLRVAHEAEAISWLKQFARSNNSASLRWHDIDHEIAQLTARGALELLLATGISATEALGAIRARAEDNVARRKIINNYRRTGRKRSEMVRERRVRRERRVLEIVEELKDYYERRRFSTLDDETPAKLRYDAARELAREENPAVGDARSAAMMILTDIDRLHRERLQTGVIRSPLD
jgi:hypothetical protein